MSYGADDYITKPYNPTILLLRIQAILKRTETNATGSCSYRDIAVNPGKGVLDSGQIQMILTKNEMLIFMTLLQHQGQIVSRDELMTRLWDNSEYISDNALTVNISRRGQNLRKWDMRMQLRPERNRGMY